MRGVAIAGPTADIVRHGSRYDYGVDEGYDWIGSEPARGFHAVGGWGLDGWDLGDWPYVIFSISADRLTVCEYVEGDLTYRTFADRAGAESFLDRMLLAWNEHVADELRAAFPGGVPRHIDAVPDRFRGPFSWHRLNVSNGVPCGSGCGQCDTGKVTA